MVVFVLILIFDGGFISPVTKQLSDNTLQYLANAISGSAVSLSVEPTPLNEVTAELTARTKELDEREAALGEQEIEARNFNTGNETDYSTYILSTVLFVLTVLIVLNYAMDWARSRRYERQVS